MKTQFVLDAFEQAMKMSLRLNAGHTPGTETARRLSSPLSGLLECADCGSGYSMINQERMGCSAARNKGTCPNRRSIIEVRMLSGLMSRLVVPYLVHAFAQAYTEEPIKARKSVAAHRTQMESDLDKASRQIENLVESKQCIETLTAPVADDNIPIYIGGRYIHAL